MNRTGGQLKQPQPELERGKKLQKQEPRRPDKTGKPGASHGEEPSDDAVDRGASPKHLHKGSDHPNQEATSQHSDRQARKASLQC